MELMPQDLLKAIPKLYETDGVLLKIKSKAQQKLNNAMNKRNTTLFFQLSEKKFQLSNL